MAHDDQRYPSQSFIQKLLFEEAQRRAPLSLVARCFACQERNVSAFIVNTLRKCCSYLGLDTPFVLSSDLDKKNELKGEERVLDINLVMGASRYINPIGGPELYDKTHFSKKGVSLSFIKARNVPYRQFQNHEFVPFLSIIDVMMFNSK